MEGDVGRHVGHLVPGEHDEVTALGFRFRQAEGRDLTRVSVGSCSAPKSDGRIRKGAFPISRNSV